MNKKAITLAFVKHMKQLNNELIKMYPNDVNFKMSITTINIFETTNTESKLVNIIGTYLMNYETQLNSRDEQFFINKDISDYKTEKILIIDKLKEYWCTFNEEEKIYVWSYLENLLKLYRKL